MKSWASRTLVAGAAAALVVTDPALAQERVAIRTEALFYGDNTEFSHPFRDGNTLLGTAATVAADVYFNANVTFSGGFFLNHRFGSEQFAETWRPVFRLTLQSEHQRFVFGTLETFEPRDGFGQGEGCAI